MSKSIVQKGLELLGESEESDFEEPKTKKRKRTAVQPSTTKWGLRKQQRQHDRLQRAAAEKGKIKFNKVGGQKRVSRVEKLRQKQGQDMTQHNIEIIRKMQKSRKRLQPELAQCFGLDIPQRDSSGSHKAKSKESKSVFTDADFEAFARSYQV